MNDAKGQLQKGVFVLSLDTEICWGVVDKPDQLIKNQVYYEQTRACISDILRLLEKYSISATWAVVGHLFLKQCACQAGHKHVDIPRSNYPWYSRDWFNEAPCSCIKEAPLWYGQDIIKGIQNCRVHQEIASHSFAHIPYGDKHTKRETVRADLDNCVMAAQKLDIELKSFVFPRNNLGYIDELYSYGFRAYRGEEPAWYYRLPKKLKKLFHIIDQMLAVTPTVSLPKINENVAEIPASMLYLPANGFRKLIPIKQRIKKAKKGIRKAIREHKIFHMWFHPFNIATNRTKLLYGLEEIFREVQSNREKGLIENKCMEQIAEGL